MEYNSTELGQRPAASTTSDLIRLCLPSSSRCSVLAYAIEDQLQAHTGAQRQWQEGEPKEHPALAALRPTPGAFIPDSSSLSLYTPRSAGVKAGRDPSLRPRRGDTLSCSPWPVPGEPEPPCPGVTPTRMSQCQGTFRTEGEY